MISLIKKMCGIAPKVKRVNSKGKKQYFEWNWWNAILKSGSISATGENVKLTRGMKFFLAKQLIEQLYSEMERYSDDAISQQNAKTGKGIHEYLQEWQQDFNDHMASKNGAKSPKGKSYLNSVRNNTTDTTSEEPTAIV